MAQTERVMATDPSPPCRPGAGRSDDAVALVADVHRRCRTVIESELRRLSGRVSLRGDELEVIDAALDDLVEELFLARLRSAPQDVAQVARLLGMTSPTASRSFSR